MALENEEVTCKSNIILHPVGPVLPGKSNIPWEIHRKKKTEEIWKMPKAVLLNQQHKKIGLIPYLAE